MSTNPQISKLLDQLTFQQGASEAEVGKIEAFARILLPQQYREFLLTSNGAYGPIGESNYIVIWGVDEVLQRNERLNISEKMPGFLAIGGDGGNTLYGIDTRNETEKMLFVETDLIGGLRWSEVFHETDSFQNLIEYIASDDQLE